MNSESALNGVGLSRREFLERATLNSAALVLATHSAAAESAQRGSRDRTGKPAYAKLCAVAPGAVTPGGGCNCIYKSKPGSLPMVFAAALLA